MSVVRVNKETYEELKRLKKITGVKSTSELLSLLVKAYQRELDKFKGDPNAFLETLKFAGSAGKYDSEKVDELLYSEEN